MIKTLNEKTKGFINKIIEEERLTQDLDNNHWLNYWKRYLKKIPKRGLNNVEKIPQWFQDKYGSITPKSTLPKRLKKILFVGIFPQTPPFMYYAGSLATFGFEKENLPKIKEITKQIIKRLEELHDKMDTVHTMPKEKIEYWKHEIRKTTLYIRTQSKWIGMTMIQEAEFKELQSWS